MLHSTNKAGILISTWQMAYQCYPGTVNLQCSRLRPTGRAVGLPRGAAAWFANDAEGEWVVRKNRRHQVRGRLNYPELDGAMTVLLH